VREEFCSDFTGDHTEDVVLWELLRRRGALVQYFRIPGKPVANERARTISRGGRTWSYTPKTTAAWRQHVFNTVYRQNPVKIDPPFSVALKFLCESGEKVSDLDNLVKAIFDALFSDKKAVPPFPFRDDKYITDCLAFKRLAGPGEPPGVKLWVIKNQITKTL